MLLARISTLSLAMIGFGITGVDCRVRPDEQPPTYRYALSLSESALAPRVEAGAGR